MKDKEIEERIEWLRAINRNRARRRVYQDSWWLFDSAGNRLDLESCVDANYKNGNPNLIVLRCPLKKYDKYLTLEENDFSKDLRISYAESELILGRDASFSIGFSSVENWERQAMIWAALKHAPNARYYSFGNHELIPNYRKPTHLVIPVEYYQYRLAGNSPEPILKVEGWSEEEVIQGVREELKRKK
ncbi:hypothetical protein HY450_01135 [Candidatus Pacearchaeota archaeon]|nr:hypothetical protein [Candidatus Pacearchaeota archaeon]